MNAPMTMGVVSAVVRHPSLWCTAVGQMRRLAPTRWWRRAPFLPLPDRRYLEFRLLTQYGDPHHRPESEDVISYLRWCRHWNRAGV